MKKEKSFNELLKESFFREATWRNVVFCIFFMVFWVAVIYILLMPTQPMEVEFECNSGFIGLDFEMYNNIQNKTCDYDGNFTCFRQASLWKDLKIKNIDGLNCKGSVKTKLPIWDSWG